MTRQELINEVRVIPGLAATINSREGKNFTNVKSAILEKYLSDAKDVETPQQPENSPLTDAFESAAIAFLVTLEQKGVLQSLLDKIQ